MTTRAKFRCDSILLRHGVAVNPEVEQTFKDGGWEAAKAEAEAKGVPLQVPVEQPTVSLKPVMHSDESPENRVFWQASPTGSIELSINNPAGAEVFELGKEYYVDFTPAEEK